MNTKLLSSALSALAVDPSDAEIFLLTPDPLKTLLIEHLTLKEPYCQEVLMDTPITYDDVIIQDSLNGLIDPSWRKEALIYIERFKSVYLEQRQVMISTCVEEWNKERDQFLAHNHILPFTSYSTRDIDQKYKSMILFKLDELQDQAIGQLMHDLPKVVKRFISINKHSPEFVMGRNRIGAVIPSDKIFESIKKILKDDYLENDSHVNDLKVGLDILYKSAQSQGKKELPKQVLGQLEGKEIRVPSYDQRESLAYLVLRSCANFAACNVIFKEIKRKHPEFKPSSILDWGSGTGSVFWSASDIWKGDINQAVGVDMSESMVTIAKKVNALLRSSGYCEIEPVFKRQISAQSEETFNMVVSSFTLSELANDIARKNTLELLWNKTTDMLVLIDRGSPYGASLINTARTQILQWSKANNEPAYIVSPCPHKEECPMGKPGINTWCHFSQRYRISKLQMEKKKCKDNHEDSRYSYIVFRKGKQEQVDPSHSDIYNWPRILGAPMKRNKHVVLDLCHKSGNMQRIVVSKSEGKLIYKDARKSHWGDLWPHKPKGKAIIKGNLPSEKDMESLSEEKE